MNQHTASVLNKITEAGGAKWGVLGLVVASLPLPAALIALAYLRPALDLSAMVSRIFG